MTLPHLVKPAMVLLFALGFSTTGLTEAPDGQDPVRPPSAYELTDAEGNLVRPLASTNATLHVLVFLSNDCPISNRYAPEIRRLFETYHDRGVAFWMVHPLADESRDAIQRHAREYNLPGVILLDSKRLLTRFAGATVTPEAVVLDRKLAIVYRGRIDDRFPELGRHRPEATQKDLRDAIEAALGGRQIPNPRTKAIGCAIPDRD